jgi:hypothetical protein
VKKDAPGMQKIGKKGDEAFNASNPCLGVSLGKLWMFRDVDVVLLPLLGGQVGPPHLHFFGTFDVPAQMSWHCRAELQRVSRALVSFTARANLSSVYHCDNIPTYGHGPYRENR